ncbi:hypothetical protein QYM36_004074, partial [Artemia franciscana]
MTAFLNSAMVLGVRRGSPLRRAGSLRTENSPSWRRSVKENTDPNYDDSPPWRQKRSTESLNREEKPPAMKDFDSSAPKSFLEDRSKVTGVSDILDRMRAGNTVSDGNGPQTDEQARSLLNKFLGAQIILQGVEPILQANGNSQNLSMAGTHVVDGVDINACDDHFKLSEMLDNCNDYEGRQKLRARIRDLLTAEKQGIELNTTPVVNITQHSAFVSTNQELATPDGESFLPLLISQLCTSLSQGACRVVEASSVKENMFDSGTESGDDRKKETLQMFMDGISESLDMPGQDDNVVSQVQSALSKLKDKLEGRDRNSAKELEVVSLISRLQSTLNSVVRDSSAGSSRVLVEHTGVKGRFFHYPDLKPVDELKAKEMSLKTCDSDKENNQVNVPPDIEKPKSVPWKVRLAKKKTERSHTVNISPCNILDLRQSIRAAARNKVKESAEKESGQIRPSFDFELGRVGLLEAQRRIEKTKQPRLLLTKQKSIGDIYTPSPRPYAPTKSADSEDSEDGFTFYGLQKSSKSYGDIQNFLSKTKSDPRLKEEEINVDAKVTKQRSRDCSIELIDAEEEDETVEVATLFLNVRDNDLRVEQRPERISAFQEVTKPQRPATLNLDKEPEISQVQSVSSVTSTDTDEEKYAVTGQLTIRAPMERQEAFEVNLKDPSKVLYTESESITLAVHKAAIKKQLSKEYRKSLSHSEEDSSTNISKQSSIDEPKMARGKSSQTSIDKTGSNHSLKYISRDNSVDGHYVDPCTKVPTRQSSNDSLGDYKLQRESSLSFAENDNEVKRKPENPPNNLINKALITTIISEVHDSFSRTTCDSQEKVPLVIQQSDKKHVIISTPEEVCEIENNTKNFLIQRSKSGSSVSRNPFLFHNTVDELNKPMPKEQKLLEEQTPVHENLDLSVAQYIRRQMPWNQVPTNLANESEESKIKPEEVTPKERPSRNENRFKRRDSMKQHARRANTINIPKAFHSENISPQRIEAPVFVPQTENDRKFLAFICKNTTTTTVTPPTFTRAGGRGVGGIWGSRFSSIKTAFESKASPPVSPEPPINRSRAEPKIDSLFMDQKDSKAPYQLCPPRHSSTPSTPVSNLGVDEHKRQVCRDRNSGNRYSVYSVNGVSRNEVNSIASLEKSKDFNGLCEKKEKTSILLDAENYKLETSDPSGISNGNINSTLNIVKLVEDRKSSLPTDQLKNTIELQVNTAVNSQINCDGVKEFSEVIPNLIENKKDLTTKQNVAKNNFEPVFASAPVKLITNQSVELENSELISLSAPIKIPEKSKQTFPMSNGKECIAKSFVNVGSSKPVSLEPKNIPVVTSKCKLLDESQLFGKSFCREKKADMPQLFHSNTSPVITPPWVKDIRRVDGASQEGARTVHGALKNSASHEVPTKRTETSSVFPKILTKNSSGPSLVQQNDEEVLKTQNSCVSSKKTTNEKFYEEKLSNLMKNENFQNGLGKKTLDMKNTEASTSNKICQKEAFQINQKSEEVLELVKDLETNSILIQGLIMSEQHVREAVVRDQVENSGRIAKMSHLNKSRPISCLSKSSSDSSLKRNFNTGVVQAVPKPFRSTLPSPGVSNPEVPRRNNANNEILKSLTKAAQSSAARTTEQKNSQEKNGQQSVRQSPQRMRKRPQSLRISESNGVTRTQYQIDREDQFDASSEDSSDDDICGIPKPRYPQISSFSSTGLRSLTNIVHKYNDEREDVNKTSSVSNFVISKSGSQSSFASEIGNNYPPKRVTSSPMIPTNTFSAQTSRDEENKRIPRNVLPLPPKPPNLSQGFEKPQNKYLPELTQIKPPENLPSIITSQNKVDGDFNIVKRNVKLPPINQPEKRIPDSCNSPQILSYSYSSSQVPRVDVPEYLESDTLVGLRPGIGFTREHSSTNLKTKDTEIVNDVRIQKAENFQIVSKVATFQKPVPPPRKRLDEPKPLPRTVFEQKSKTPQNLQVPRSNSGSRVAALSSAIDGGLFKQQDSRSPSPRRPQSLYAGDGSVLSTGKFSPRNSIGGIKSLPKQFEARISPVSAEKKQEEILKYFFDSPNLLDSSSKLTKPTIQVTARKDVKKPSLISSVKKKQNDASDFDMSDIASDIDAVFDDLVKREINGHMHGRTVTGFQKSVTASHSTNATMIQQNE